MKAKNDPDQERLMDAREKQANVLTLKDHLPIDSENTLERLASTYFKDDPVVRWIISQNRREEREAAEEELKPKLKEVRQQKEHYDSLERTKRWWNDMAEISEAMNKVRANTQGLTFQSIDFAQAKWQ